MLSVFHVLPLEIQLSKEEGSDPINGFNRATCLCLSQGTSKTIPNAHIIMKIAEPRLIDVIANIIIRAILFKEVRSSVVCIRS
jgi:hypothetical protein